MSIVIPHELTHLVFDTATQNPYHEPPHWLNEGLAVYISEGYSTPPTRAASPTPFAARCCRSRRLADGFPPSRQDLFYLGYAEGVSAIDFFIRQYRRAEAGGPHPLVRGRGHR